MDQDLVTRLAWSKNSRDIGPAVRFIIANTTPSYISHGELMDGRAITPTKWSKHLRDVLTGDFLQAIRDVRAGRFGYRLLVIRSQRRIVAIAFIEFCKNRNGRYGVIHDLVVGTAVRRKGIARQMYSWIIGEMRKLRCTAVFFEAGAHNVCMRSLARRAGYRAVSTVWYTSL